MPTTASSHARGPATADLDHAGVPEHAAVRGLLVAVCALIPLWALVVVGAVVLR